MKILVTGSQGYVCSVLLPKLLDWKDSTGGLVVSGLVGVDNLMFSQMTHAGIVDDARYRFIRQDVTDFDAMSDLYEWADCIIPAACLTGAPICEHLKSQAWEVNYIAIKNMLDHLTFIGKLDTIVVGLVSNSGYGIKPAGVYTTEEDDLNPVSTYGKTKVSLEAELNRYRGIIYRLATVYGPSPFHRIGLLVNTFVYRALRDKVLPVYQGHFQRNYLYINDCVEAIKLGITRYEEMCGQTYNVGDSRANTTKLELAKLVASLTGAEVIEVDNLKDPDTRSYLVSNSKIETMGFRPSKTMGEVILDLINLYSAVDERSHNVYFGTT